MQAPSKTVMPVGQLLAVVHWSSCWQRKAALHARAVGAWHWHAEQPGSCSPEWTVAATSNAVHPDGHSHGGLPDARPARATVVQLAGGHSRQVPAHAPQGPSEDDGAAVDADDDSAADDEEVRGADDDGATDDDGMATDEDGATDDDDTAAEDDGTDEVAEKKEEGDTSLVLARAEEETGLEVDAPAADVLPADDENDPRLDETDDDGNAEADDDDVPAGA